MIKSHRLYSKYISYLNYKSNRISIGGLKLLMISESYFNDFVYDYYNNQNFRVFIDDIFLVENRDEKINNILHGVDK
jgi:hypothetical protein